MGCSVQAGARRSATPASPASGVPTTSGLSAETGKKFVANTLSVNLEKSLSLPIADSLGVNVNESERERNGIIRGQFCGVRRAGPIFRGVLLSVSFSLS